MSSHYDKALNAGYSEKEIKDFLQKKDPRAEKALKAGYSTKEISEYLSKNSQPQESLGSNIGRQIGRGAARVSETVLGAPRAFGEFAESLVPEKALIKGAEKIGLGGGAKTLLETTKKYAPYKLFPKSEQVRDVNKTLFGKSVEPKNQWEAKADSLVSDFTALALPLPGSKFKLLKPALVALGGNAASELVGQVGGTEKQQTYAKIGTILFGSMINPKSAEKLKDSLYEQARKAKPDDATIQGNNLLKKTNQFQKQLLKGDPSAASKGKSLSLIKEIKKKIKNNEINIDELEEFKKNINEARSGLYDEFKVDKVGRKSAKRNLDHVSKIIDDTLDEYGKMNPEWEAFYRPANEVHGAIAQSQRARNVIGRVAKKYGIHAILPALGIGHFGGKPALAGLAGTAAVGTAIVGGAEIAAKFAKSPTLRKHYTNLINSALKEDTVAIYENLKKLEKDLEDSNK